MVWVVNMSAIAGPAGLSASIKQVCLNPEIFEDCLLIVRDAKLNIRLKSSAHFIDWVARIRFLVGTASPP